MTTTVSFKPSATIGGEANFAKTGAFSTIWQALADNSDTTFVKRVSLTSAAGATLDLDVSTVPAGKTLNRWKLRLRNLRPTTKGKLTLACVVESWQYPGTYISPGPGSLAVNGIQAAAAWSESGYFPGTTSPFDSQGHPSAPWLVMFDQCTASADRANIYEAWIEAEYVDPPTATVTSPSGAVTDTNFPLISWTFSTTESNPQAQAVVRVFDAATYGGGGFDPATSTPVWETTIVGSGASTQVTTPLLNGGTYRAYVLVSESTGIILSPAAAWAFSTFNIALLAPAVPSLTAGFDAVNNKTQITVAGHTNLLTAEQANLEGGTTTGWAVGTNCAIANSVTVGGKVGTHALRLTSSAGGDMYATTLTGVSGVPVLAGAVYTAVASFRSAVTARACRVDIAWYTAAGAFISATSGSPTNDAAGAWTTDLLVVGTAPATAAFASVRTYVLATGGAAEVHYVDTIAIYPGIFSTSVNLVRNPSFEIDTSTWLAFAGSPITVARSVVRSTHGVACGRFTSTSTADGIGGCFILGLTPGATYTVSADIYIETVSGTVSVKLGAVVSGNVGTTVSTKDAWTRPSNTFVADATSVFIAFTGDFTAAAQWFDVDSVQVEAGPTPSVFSLPTAGWTAGGFGLGSVILERSNDGGVSWLLVRRIAAETIINGGVQVDATSQTYSVTDYEAARPGTVLYRARYSASLSAVVVTSDYTTNLSLVTSSDGRTWLKPVEAPGLNRAVWVRKSTTSDSISEDTTVMRPMGRAGRAVVLSGDMGGTDGKATFVAPDAVAREGLLTLLRHQGTILFQEAKLDGFGQGRQRYVRFIDDRALQDYVVGIVTDAGLSFVDVGPGDEVLTA